MLRTSSNEPIVETVIIMILDESSRVNSESASKFESSQGPIHFGTCK